METVLSGIRSTGNLHLGNYFGAVKKESKGAVEFNKERVKDLFSMLDGELEDNCTDALNIIEEIREEIPSDMVGSEMDQLEQAVNGYDFDEALEVSGKLIRELFEA